jgi:hypothetical protein
MFVLYPMMEKRKKETESSESKHIVNYSSLLFKKCVCVCVCINNWTAQRKEVEVAMNDSLMSADSVSQTPNSSSPEIPLDVLLERIPLGRFHYRLLLICGMFT